MMAFIVGFSEGIVISSSLYPIEEPRFQTFFIFPISRKTSGDALSETAMEIPNSDLAIQKEFSSEHDTH